MDERVANVSRRVVPITPVVPACPDGGAEVTVSLYEAQRKIYPRSVQGRFSLWRWAFVWLTQIIFYGLPWLEWGQRQAVLFDLGARRFYLFGMVLYPQDFIYLTGLLVISALMLFLFTAVAGRLWCGYACPQTVYSEIFLFIEHKIEGDRSSRMRLDGTPMNIEKLVKKWFKHIVWLGVAMWTGFTFVGYFTPVHDLGLAFFQTRMGSWEVFWVLFYGLATYGNAGFMREQVCKYMCPYARFQSAMFDKDTLIVSYDEARGEPRGGRPRGAEHKRPELGECVDCTLCVQVCPTGIDIRNGLQYECIGCGACADVCDTVMGKMGYLPGLVRYTTQNALSNGWTGGQILRRVWRPRVLVYTAILLTLTFGLLLSLTLRTPLKVDVIRDRGSMARIGEHGSLENVYRLQIMNATEHDQSYRINASGIAGLQVASDAQVRVPAVQSRWVPVRLQIPYGSMGGGSYRIEFEVQAQGDSSRVVEKSVFVVPR
jgi:cytochrome c oxidase accessory protein FixG